MADLANPYEWMADLPKFGVSLGTKALTVSNRDAAERNQNPTVTGTYDASVTITPEASETLSFDVQDDDESVTIWNYTSVGGFGSTFEEVSPGEQALSIFAPEDLSDAENAVIYVFVEDNRGGSGVWIDDIAFNP